MTSLEDINDPTEAMNATLVLFAKAFQLTAPTKNNQRTSSNPRNHQFTQPGINMSQDRQSRNVRGNGGNPFGQAEGSGNGNQARCYNCRGLEEFDFMAAAGDLNEIEEVNANCILMANLQHASTSGTQFDKAPIYDTDGSAEVQLNDNYYNNEIFNMFTQEEQCANLLEPIPKPQLVPQNNNHVTSISLSMVPSGGIVETSSAPNEETRAHQETIYRNLVDQVTQINMWRNILITRVYFVEGLGYNLFSVGQFCDSDLEVAFRRDACFVRNLEGVDLLKGDRSINLYTINLHEMASASPICLIAQASSTKSWLWHQPKFVRDFKSLAKEADESLDKQKSLELKIERLLKASVSHDIMSIVKKGFVDEKEYVVLWNNWYTKCEECKYDKISYDKAYNDMQQKVERLQAQLRDLKGKSSDTPSASNTLDPLNQKLETKIVDKPKLIAVTPYSKKLHVSISSHSIPQPREFNVVKDSNVIAPGMFKIDPYQTSRVDLVPNNESSASIRTNPITNSQRHVTFKKNVSSDTVVQICLWCIDSGCSKHMTGNIKLLINFVWKFLGTVRFGNDHIAAVLGYGDLKWGNVTISMVYFVEGLGHNLFSIGQFYNADLEVAFRKNTCFIRDLDGVDLLKGNHFINLYTINLYDMASASPICLMARATLTKSWLWHQQLSHLNFDTINDLAKNDLVSGFPSLNMLKNIFVPLVSKEKGKEPLTHPNLTKDETPEVIKNFLKKISFRLQAPVIIVRTENGTKFKNHALKEYFNSVGITHETSAAKTPQQNGVVERRNRTLVEAARTMLLALKY
nr:hypothetical protein [Tanacetum cinerariifolium]